MIDRVKQHPEIKRDFMDMLGRDNPKGPSFEVVRTARAFQFARNYMDTLTDKFDSSSPYRNSQSKEIHEEIAYDSLNKVHNMREGISKEPDRFIFSEPKKEDHPRKIATITEVGHAFCQTSRGKSLAM